MTMVPLCPAIKFVGFARVLLPPSVKEKLLPDAKFGVIVAASVNVVTLPTEAL